MLGEWTVEYLVSSVAVLLFVAVNTHSEQPYVVVNLETVQVVADFLKLIPELDGWNVSLTDPVGYEHYHVLDWIEIQLEPVVARLNVDAGHLTLRGGVVEAFRQMYSWVDFTSGDCDSRKGRVGGKRNIHGKRRDRDSQRWYTENMLSIL